MLRVAASFLALLLLVLAGCHGFFTSPVLQSIAITPTTVALNQSQQLTATGTYDDGSTNQITSGLTWSATNGTGTVTINSSTGVVNGNTAGTATVNVVSGSITGSVQLTVTSGTLQSITVSCSPQLLSLSLLTTQSTCTATGNYSGGGTAPITTSVNWQTSNSTAASITSAGVVTEISAAGAVIITATDPTTGISGTANLVLD
jgi:hypothetical protein